MMADFFTRLAGRTLGIAPVAQPIIASIFAPQPLTSGILEAEASVGGLEMEAEQATPHPTRATRYNARPPAHAESPIQSLHEVVQPPFVQQHTRNETVSPIPAHVPIPILPLQDNSSNSLQVEHLEPQIQVFSDARVGVPLQIPSLEPFTLAIPSQDTAPAKEVVQGVTHQRDYTRVGVSTQDTFGEQMYEEESMDSVQISEAMYSQEGTPVRQTEPTVAQDAGQDKRNISLQESLAFPRFSARTSTMTTRRLSTDEEQQTLDREGTFITASTLQGGEHHSAYSYEEAQQPHQTVTEMGGLEQLVVATHDEPQAEADILQERMDTGSRQVEEYRASTQQLEEAARTHTEMQGVQSVTRTEHSSMTGRAQHTAEYAQPTMTPTIHVTIGRIDVRAVTMPTPEPKPRTSRQEPKVSLKQYLGRKQ